MIDHPVEAEVAQRLHELDNECITVHGLLHDVEQLDSHVPLEKELHHRVDSVLKSKHHQQREV